MLTTYFKHPFTLNKLRSGPAGAHLDEFICRLSRDGYSYPTIRYHIRGAGQLSTWAQAIGLPVTQLNVAALERFRDHLASRGKLYTKAGLYRHSFVGARLFVTFLQASEIVAAPPRLPCAP